MTGGTAMDRALSEMGASAKRVVDALVGELAASRRLENPGAASIEQLERRLSAEKRRSRSGHWSASEMGTWREINARADLVRARQETI